MRARDEITWFRLASDSDLYGVRCGAEGVFFGPVPLLAHSEGGSAQKAWAPRPITEINAELGIPIPEEFRTFAKAR